MLLLKVHPVCLRMTSNVYATLSTKIQRVLLNNRLKILQEPSNLCIKFITTLYRFRYNFLRNLSKHAN